MVSTTPISAMMAADFAMAGLMVAAATFGGTAGDVPEREIGVAEKIGVREVTPYRIIARRTVVF